MASITDLFLFIYYLLFSAAMFMLGYLYGRALRQKHLPENFNKTTKTEGLLDTANPPKGSSGIPETSCFKGFSVEWQRFREFNRGNRRNN